jgi:hypothetical protein
VESTPVLRENSFIIGGGLTIGLGVALAAGLIWAGAGFVFFNAWLAAGIAVGLGVFFIKVGRDEGENRRQTLRRLETESEDGNRPARP